VTNLRHSRLFLTAARWLGAALLLGALAAPAAQAATATLPVSLQGKYKISKISANIENVGSFTIPTPSSAKAYIFTITSTGLSKVTAAQGQRFVSNSGLSGSVKVKITKATTTAFSATASGSVTVSEVSVPVTFNANSIKGSLSKSGLTITTALSGSLSIPIIGKETFNGTVTILLTKS
jgi:hypothetical protein